MKMDYRRIIPCLDVKDGRLVKGVKFVELQDVGDPAENAKAYCEAGADELVFLDITATIENRKTILDAVKRTVDAISSSRYRRADKCRGFKGIHEYGCGP